MRHSYIIGIGSNFEADKNITKALEALKGIFDELICSRFIETKPIDMPNNFMFINGIAHFFSELDREKVKDILKKIELDSGRTVENKKNGIIPIDIDIIVWNDTVVSKDFERDYIQTLMAELHIKIST